MSGLHRRRFLQASASLTTGLLLGADRPRVTPPPRPTPPRKRIAVITTTYYYLSHAYHICSRFFDGCLVDGQYTWPECGIASLFVEQTDGNDLSRELAEKYRVPRTRDIAQALTLGTGQLAVDGVLLIAEHGNYPLNEKLQKLYPRHAMYQKIVEVFRQTGRSVPVFVDKHLSYDRHQAAEMVATAQTLGFPLYAGSSLPITWRRPELELPLGCQVRDALVVSRGDLEIFGFHALESLQCMVERRAGGERGVKAVRCLQGEAVWKAGDEGVWSWDLLDAALSRSPSRNVGDVRQNCRHFLVPAARSTMVASPVAFVVEYVDGLRATVLILNGHVDDTTFAAQLAGQARPATTLFYLPPPPGAAYLEALALLADRFIATGRAPYPVQRTQLTGGVLDVALESRLQNGRRLETPELAIRYQPPADSGYRRGDYVSP